MSENQRDPQYKLRWPEELRDKVAESANQHNRSMNAEIVVRLMESFSPNRQHPFHGVEIEEIIETTYSNDALLKMVYKILDEQKHQHSRILKALEKVHQSELTVKGKTIEALTGMPVEVVADSKKSEK